MPQWNYQAILLRAAWSMNATARAHAWITIGGLRACGGLGVPMPACLWRRPAACGKVWTGLRGIIINLLLSFIIKLYCLYLHYTYFLVMFTFKPHLGNCLFLELQCYITPMTNLKCDKNNSHIPHFLHCGILRCGILHVAFLHSVTRPCKVWYLT